MSTYTVPEPAYQVTDWAPPEEPIESQWGKLCYNHWLQAECSRWKEKWRDAWIVQHPDGRVAMFSLAKYMKLTVGEK
jgi:hypothetical protein